MALTDVCRTLFSDPRLGWAVAVALLAGVVRGATGFGQALVFVPLAGLVYRPSVAIPLLWVADGLVTPLLLRPHLRRVEPAEIVPLVIGSTVLLPGGIWILKYLDPILLRWIICGVVLLSTAAIAAGWRLRTDATWRWSLGIGGFSGLAGGATGMSGPPLILFWLGRSADSRLIRSNIFLYLWLLGLVSLAFAAGQQLLPARVLIDGLAIAPGYALATLLGNLVFDQTSRTSTVRHDAVFRRLALGLCAASACIGLPIWR